MPRYTYNITTWIDEELEEKALYCEVDYTYHKEEKEVWTESNGDPGTPGYPAYVDIHAIYMPLKDENGNTVGTDIMPILHEMDIDLDNIENQILKENE